MYFLIGIWGHDRRIYAAVKFFLYTMAGSVLMLVAIIYLSTRRRARFDYATILSAIGSGTASRSRSNEEIGCSSRSSSRLRSRSRSSRCIPGCPTRTWKRPRLAPSCWPPSC